MYLGGAVSISITYIKRVPLHLAPRFMNIQEYDPNKNCQDDDHEHVLSRNSFLIFTIHCCRFGGKNPEYVYCISRHIILVFYYIIPVLACAISLCIDKPIDSPRNRFPTLNDGWIGGLDCESSKKSTNLPKGDPIRFQGSRGGLQLQIENFKLNNIYIYMFNVMFLIIYKPLIYIYIHIY